MNGGHQHGSGSVRRRTHLRTSPPGADPLYALIDEHFPRFLERLEAESLARAREAIVADDAVLSGTPCIKGTRIPAHDVAEMLDNGDDAGALRAAWPVLAEEQIEAAVLYASAYPRRGRPRNAPFWRSRGPVVSGEEAYDALPPAR